MLLFEDSKYIDLKLPDAAVHYYPKFLSSNESECYFQSILSKTKWQHDDITVFGKTYKQPRLTSFYSENTKTLNYSNISMKPNRFYSELLDIKNAVEQTIEHKFTSCLLNLYRDGSDSNGWHADDENELGVNPVIASVSFGAGRMFHLKHKNKPHKFKLLH